VTDERERLLLHRRTAFIRAHHPDLGGDPDIYIAGIQRIDRELAALRMLRAATRVGSLPRGRPRPSPARERRRWFLRLPSFIWRISCR
jgi:hypothetical protein